LYRIFPVFLNIKKIRIKTVESLAELLKNLDVLLSKIQETISEYQTTSIDIKADMSTDKFPKISEVTEKMSWVKPSSEKEDLQNLWQEKNVLRDELKSLNCELMKLTKDYAVANSISPRTLCSKVNDTMNELIQGVKSRDIKTLNELPSNAQIRDYLPARELAAYVAIHRIAINEIINCNVDPIEGVTYACDVYLGDGYTPKLSKKAENIPSQGRRIKQFKKMRTNLTYPPGYLQNGTRCKVM
jgi:hypothetical protein